MDVGQCSSKSGYETSQADNVDFKSIPPPNGQFSSTSVVSLSSLLPSLTECILCDPIVQV